jgi:hypothetical protein
VENVEMSQAGIESIGAKVIIKNNSNKEMVNVCWQIRFPHVGSFFGWKKKGWVKRIRGSTKPHEMVVVVQGLLLLLQSPQDA